MIGRRWAQALAVFVLAWPVPFAQAEPATTHPRPAIARATTQPAEPDEPPATTGQSAEDGGPCVEARARAEAGTAAERCLGQLELARCLLVVQSAPLLSAELRRPGEGGERLSGVAKQGLSAIEAASMLLKEAGEAIPADQVGQVQDRLDLLRAFGELFAALGEGCDSAEGRARLIDACGEVAIYLDDSDGAIVESAKLWQGAAYRRAGRPERALQVLRPTLTSPVSPDIGFWARLERCRALADRGGYAAAVALSLRLSARTEGWFEGRGPQARADAEYTLRQMRIELLRGWARRLRESGEAKQAGELEARAAQLADEGGASAARRWLALDSAIAGTQEWAAGRAASRPSDDEDD